MADETGTAAKIKKLNKRLRDMSDDSRFSNEDREEVLKELKKLDLGKILGGKLPGGSVVKPKPKKKDINRTKEYMDFKSGKKDEGYKVMEAAKGGMVKKYMGGGSVHKNKNKMATTKGWGASRKT